MASLDMPVLLVVTHSRTGGTAAMTEAVVAGATDEAIEGVDVVLREALEAGVDDVLSADGYLIGTPENFGYVSGAVKHFFETIYHPCLDHTRGRPYGLFVKAGNDGSGAVQSTQRIIAGLGWREVAAPVVAVGDVSADILDACVELGGTIAAGLALDLY